VTLDECLKKHGIKDVRCGAECGDGWVPIIDAFLTLAGNNYYVVGQLKEKFGTLHIYLDTPYDQRMETLVSFAEKASEHTCEDCGGTGELRRGAWIRTLCDACDAKR
jgi:hypothetical protein